MHAKLKLYWPYLVVLTLLTIGIIFIIKYLNCFIAIFSNPEQLKSLLTSSLDKRSKILAPLILIGLQTLQIIFAPFPGHWVGFVSGFVFGVLHGLIYSLTGILLGATIDFWLGRLLGRKFLMVFVSTEKMKIFDFYVLKYGTAIIFLLLLLPFSPLGDVVYYLAGLTAVPFLFFLFMVFLARLPNALFFNLLGAKVVDLGMPIVLVFVGVLVVVGVIFYLKFRNYWIRWLNRLTYLKWGQKD